MKKFEFGVFALCVLIGARVGSTFGIAVTVCVYMIVSGLVEEFNKRPKKSRVKKKEN